jgi:hypothetical protein
MQQLSFFNTTKEAGTQLQACITDAKKQDDLVLEVFKIKQQMTPSDCWQYLIRTARIDSNCPLTSIRRSITVLTKKGMLHNTEEKKTGIFGRPENIWQLKNI